MIDRYPSVKKLYNAESDLPITCAEFRSYLRLEAGDIPDDEIQHIIRQAIDYYEKEHECTLLQTTYRMDHQQLNIRLFYPPVFIVEFVQILNAQNRVSKVCDKDVDYHVSYSGGIATVHMCPNKYSSSTVVRVQYKAGYGTVNEALTGDENYKVDTSMPKSIEYLILRMCQAIYHGHDVSTVCPKVSKFRVA